jgi:CDP-ribitol ribitolphosphotransferase
VADVLITDYSSVVYEFSLLDKPMLFYAYDKDTYSVVHGFHCDYDAIAPGKVCATFDELVKALQNEDYDMSRLEAFRRENFDYADTRSADRVIDWLILDDPTEGGQATSESACRDPATAAVAASPRSTASRSSFTPWSTSMRTPTSMGSPSRSSPSTAITLSSC